jgi:hypothetical protein
VSAYQPIFAKRGPQLFFRSQQGVWESCTTACRVILAENDWPKWLGEEPASEQELLALLKPRPDQALKIWPVDKMVGNVRNNGPQLVLPVL